MDRLVGGKTAIRMMTMSNVPVPALAMLLPMVSIPVGIYGESDSSASQSRIWGMDAGRIGTHTRCLDLRKTPGQRFPFPEYRQHGSDV
jgi:hypothetical protein